MGLLAHRDADSQSAAPRLVSASGRTSQRGVFSGPGDLVFSQPRGNNNDALLFPGSELK
jgi:hypothetical protein